MHAFEFFTVTEAFTAFAFATVGLVLIVVVDDISRATSALRRALAGRRKRKAQTRASTATPISRERRRRGAS